MFNLYDEVKFTLDRTKKEWKIVAFSDNIYHGLPMVKLISNGLVTFAKQQDLTLCTKGGK